MKLFNKLTGLYERWLIANGAAIVVTSSDSEWSYGNWPQTQYLSGSASSATQTDNTVIYEITDARMYSSHLFENTSATDDVDVYVSLDGSNYNANPAAVQLLNDVTTGGGVRVLTIPAGSVAELDGSFYGIRVLKNGATAENPSIRYSHTVK